MKEFLALAQRFRQTPIIDDAFVTLRNQFDAELTRLSTTLPPIVCLCGSTRFIETWNEWRKRLTQEGNIVLAIEIVTTQNLSEDPQHVNPELKVRLDELHKRKIDLADWVLVLNVNGYIGESTRGEIEYAQRLGKTIHYLEKPDQNDGGNHEQN